MIIKIPRYLSIGHIIRLSVLYVTLDTWEKVRLKLSYTQGKKLKKLSTLLSNAYVDFDPVFVSWITEGYSYTNREFNQPSVLAYYNTWFKTYEEKCRFITEEVNKSILNNNDDLIKIYNTDIPMIANVIGLNRYSIDKDLITMIASDIKDKQKRLSNKQN